MSFHWAYLQSVTAVWKVFALIFSIRTSFSNSSRDVAMATDFWQNWRNDLYSTSTRWRFEMDSIIAILIKKRFDGILCKFDQDWSSNPQRNCKLCRNLTIIVHLPPGVRKWIRISQFWFLLVNRQSFLYILWKFGEIWINDPGVLGERSCTVRIDNCYHA